MLIAGVKDVAEDIYETRVMADDMEAMEQTRKSVSLRMDDFPYRLFERLVKELGETRASLAEKLLQAAVFETWQTLEQKLNLPPFYIEENGKKQLNPELWRVSDIPQINKGE